MSIEDLLPLSPAIFFDMTVEVPYAKDLDFKGAFKGKHLLLDLGEMLNEERFAQCAAAWSEHGLQFLYDVEVPFTCSEYPNFEKSDCVEICIDTRGLKDARAIHRFCHHFLVLAAADLDTSALEITRFRGEDKHELCEPSAIQVEREFHSKGYRLKVTLPSAILHGFDPIDVSLIGFTTVIHRAKGEPQHFHLSNRDFQVLLTPMLYANLHLTRPK
ncbi:MAG: hypothetical protein K9M07_04375 [Simkaniaceae bacterium]|nr:hypothetical protein [Simkaniaceae bacterium]